MELVPEANMDCILLASRYTLLDRSAERGLLELCKSYCVSLVAGGVFNSGILATGPVDGAHFEYVEASDDIKARVAKMEAIAGESGVSLAAAALQYPLRNPQISSLLISSTNSRTLLRNFASLNTYIRPDIFDRCGEFALR